MRSTAPWPSNGQTRHVPHSDLESRISEFQRVIEARDVGAADGVLHRDYALCLVVPSSVVFPRAAWLATLPDYVVHEWSLQERQVEADGDVAVVLQRGFQRATVHGEERNGLFVVSDIWRREGGVWRVWKRHSTPLSAGEMPAV